jgi:DNA replication protein DnaC
VDEWYPLFGAQPLAGAALDRLLHHAHVVVMDGDTHRSPTAAKRARRGGGRAPG